MHLKIKKLIFNSLAELIKSYLMYKITTKLILLLSSILISLIYLLLLNSCSYKVTGRMLDNKTFLVRSNTKVELEVIFDNGTLIKGRVNMHRPETPYLGLIKSLIGMSTYPLGQSLGKSNVNISDSEN